jgi:hypothetical protein
MWAQKRLLQLLIGYWNPEADAFMLDGQSLTIEVDDIYFITWFIPPRRCGKYLELEVGLG